MRTSGKFWIKTAATAVLFVWAAIPAMAADVTGSWALTVMTDAGSGVMNFVLQQEGETVTGNVTGDAGNAPVTGKVEDETITFSHNLPD